MTADHALKPNHLFVAVLTTVIVGRLAQLQLVQYDYFSTQSQGNRIRIQPVPPTRGLILDRNGLVLAENQASFDLELIPEQVPDLDDALERLAGLGLLAREDLPEIREWQWPWPRSRSASAV